MLRPSPPDPLRVLVVSSDVTFRRVAAAALSRAGHEVFVAAATDYRAVRLARLRRAAVVVIDLAGGDAAPTMETPTGPDAPAIVYVDDQHGPGALARWGPLDELVARVEQEAQHQPALRLVSGDQ